ncbi:DNA repair protein RAD50-like [Pieris brassicae]|uniref:DNA repair protein RAD50-like n=1 Tax=Pieris brassicae TaxID=7116 RepID=UPI001E6621D1|nr:DNA repair protein RAD50-like [Pieris brassicae]
MTNLEKLLIKGIRSFNPNDSNTIEFYSPLTLIVGQNGTGKTTIIECLKYITTGNLPPNSKGGAFVYDTKLAQEIDVKAMIKLSFRNIYNKKLVSTRVLQSSFKRNKYEQKTIENTLFVEDEKGTHQNISNKIGNIDKEIPYHLGVSSSILENVIFCHQEDSCWPISEPANVKKKFDDIFSSSKYSKALDSLKSTKREVSAQIKLKYQELEFLYKIKDKRNDIEKRIENGKEELLIKENKIKEYDESYNACDKLIRDLNTDIDKVEHVNNRIKLKLSEIDKYSGKVLDDPKIDEVKCKDILQSKRIEELETEIAKTTKILLDEEERQRILDNEKKLYEKNKAEIDEINSDKSKLKNTLLALTDETIELKLFLEKQTGIVIDKLKNLKKDSSDEMIVSQDNITNIDRTFIERVEKIKEFKDLKDDPEINIERSYEFEIKSLEDNNLKHEIKKLERELFENQLIYEKELRNIKESYLVDQQKKRIEEIKIELDNSKQIQLEIQKDDILKRIEDLKNKIKETYQLKNKFNVYKEMFVSKTSMIKENYKTDLNSLYAINIGKNNLESFIENFSFLNKDKLNKEDLKEMLIIDVTEKCRSLILNNIQKDCDVDTFEELISAFKNIKFFEIRCKKNECPLCTNKLNNTEKYKSRLEKVIAKIPENLKKNNDKVESITSLQNEADAFNLQIKEIFSECKINLSLTFSNLFSKFDIPDCFGELLEEKDLALLDLEEEYSSILAKIELHKELKDLERNISTIKNTVDIKELEKKLNSLRSQVNRKKEDLGLIEDKIAQLKLKQKRIEEIKTIRELLKKKKEIKEDIRIFEENRSKDNIRNLEDDYKNKYYTYEKLKDKLYRKKMDIEFKQTSFESKLKKIKETEENIKNVEERIQEVAEKYSIPSFCSKKYEENRLNLIRNKDTLSSLKDDLRTSTDLKLEAKKHIDHYKASEAILNLRSEVKRIETLFVEGLSKNRIQEIKNYSKSNNLDLMSSFTSILKEKKDIVENKKTRIIANRSMIQGEYNQIKILIDQLTKELDVEYKDINDKYNKAYIEHKVLELSVKDLDKCINCLDKAIIDFHSSKIEEINGILKDLWSSSYKGSDIDYIEIKSESLGSKTYSYRISLIKNGVELDMRGRSSAGQRMIASIIIRLALSQTFSTTFNVLALDEPTTNLDKENIESLAHTLLKIIRSSSKDSRFQLIIITHDEDFVQILSREGPEYFYRLKRNEKGDSLIQRHSIY